MVNAALKYETLEVELPKNPLFLPSPLRYGSVSIAQMVNNGHRYDASAYNIEAMNALRKVKRNKHGFVYLLSDDGLIDNAYYPGRWYRRAFLLTISIRGDIPKTSKVYFSSYSSIFTKR